VTGVIRPHILKALLLTGGSKVSVSVGQGRASVASAARAPRTSTELLAQPYFIVEQTPKEQAEFNT
jgi:antitoxin component of MazEF toxin-antitoxin module